MLQLMSFGFLELRMIRMNRWELYVLCVQKAWRFGGTCKAKNVISRQKGEFYGSRLHQHRILGLNIQG